MMVMSATAGRAGGERAVLFLRGYMEPFWPRILQGPEINLAANYEACDANFQLTGKVYIKTLTELMGNLHALSEA